MAKMKIVRLTKLTIILFSVYCNIVYCQNKQYNAEYYFQKANNYMIVPGYRNDSLEKNCIVLYSKAIKLDPKFWQAYRNRSRFYMDFDSYKDALADLNQAIKYCHNDDKFGLIADRGNIYYKMNEYAKAIADYNSAIPNSGNPDYLYLFRAKSNWKLGQKDQACRDYLKAIKFNPYIVKDKEFLNCN